jgi:hypothetical protein
MYEVFAIITDTEGSRCIPTGEGSINPKIAEELKDRRMLMHPNVRFFVQFTNSEDSFNAY